MRTFPKLLVATEFTPTASGGGPAIVRQMLRDWPTESLYWWSCATETNAQFSLPVEAHYSVAIPHRLYPHERFTSAKSAFLERFWAPSAARHFQRILNRIAPEVIWCIPHAWAIPPTAKVLLNMSRPTFHISIHDYADTKSAETRYGESRAREMARLSDRLYAAAMTRDAISRPMLEDLKRRTGCEGALARAGLEQEDFDYLASKTEIASDQIRIAYSGTIIVEDTFAIFVKAVSRIRRQVANEITLELFSSHSYRNREWFDPTWMKEHGLVAESKLAQMLRNCSWGLAPMSLTDNDPKYNRFSLPTKFVSYLAAGLPVITIAHASSSLASLAQKYDLGLCITTSDSEAMEQSLAENLSVETLWTRFGAELQRCARAEFDATPMRNTLYDNLARSSTIGLHN